MASAFERQLKRLGLFGLSRLARSPRGAPGEDDLRRIRRILVVRPDERIGNAILIIPLLNALKTAFPQAQTSLLMSRRYWDLREFIPAVDEFIPFDKKHYARNPAAFMSLVRSLRRRAFDLVFDASGDHSVSFTHLAITAFSGGHFRIGHDRGEAGRCYDVSVPVHHSPRHEVERHLDLLRALRPVDVQPHPRLKLPSRVEDTRDFRREFGWRDDRPTVIIHPGARGRKRWPAPHFASVARVLAGEHGFQIGVVWGPADTAAADEMLKLAPKSVTPVGVLPFRDFVTLAHQCDIFLSGDCGPMHLASATPPRIAAVAVFVVDSLARYRPLGPRDQAILDDPAQPDIAGIVSRIVNLAGERMESSESVMRSATA